jgi:hypothetical protein
MTRPRTLAEVAQRVIQGDSFDRCLAEFLDQFQFQPDGAALAEPPVILANRFGELGQIQDAYLAATAEELGRRFAQPIPDWTADTNRMLRKPWFASRLASLRAVLLWESPVGFRSRNLFVSENALSRA